MRLLKRFGFYAILALLLLYPLTKTIQASKHVLPPFAFLIPESADKAVSTQVWLHAAQEEGLPVEVIHYEDLLNAFQNAEITSKVILVPDEVARYAPATLLSILQNYVSKGGKLVLVADAFTQEYNQRLTETFPLETYFNFPKVQGRIGDTLQFKHDPVQMKKEWIDLLQIPPGSYTPVEWSAPAADPNALKQICNYQSKQPPYPHWETLPVSEFKGTTLMQTTDGNLVAGIQKFGKGETLWINMPLSYLKKRTDGLFLHSFLRWISEDWVGLPKLLGVPNGVGGMVLNIHVDSNAALPGLEIMKSIDMFSQGPFSIHVTAGPDAHTIGDGLGFNLPANGTSQQWVKYWVEHGHEVGSHGGWVHDYFGLNMPEHATPAFEKFLEDNLYWVNKISGKPVLEYSSPVGNHPVWVDEWIEKHGYRSYYFTGNTSMGPTRAFRDELFTDEKLWSFPVSAYQQIASFEEATDQHVPQSEIQAWLLALSHFVVDHQTVRLFYFHPPGVKFYQTPLREWMKLNQLIAKQGHFKWYTMNQMVDFLNSREAVHWSLQPGSAGSASTIKRVVVQESAGLSKMVWRFPKKSVKTASVLVGTGAVRENQNFFEVQPSNDQAIEIQYEENIQ